MGPMKLAMVRLKVYTKFPRGFEVGWRKLFRVRIGAVDGSPNLFSSEGPKGKNYASPFII